MKMKKANLTRRTFLGGSAAASAGLLLRGLATGIPPALLLNPHKAMSQGANMRRQTLIMSVSQAGDPVNINCPGSYINDAPRNFANNPLLSAVNGNFGGQTVRTAQPWAALPNALRRRLAFFHLKTFAAAHTEFDQTLTLRGAVKSAAGNGSEMFPSMVAQLNASHLGAIQQEPLLLTGSRVSYESQPIQVTKPTAIKSLFTGAESALGDLRPLRDDTLDRLYAQLRASGSRPQMDFLERFVRGRDQARTLGNSLGTLLDRIPLNNDDKDSVEDQVIAACALAQLGVAPAIIINIPFGRDNHQDSTLEAEADQTRRGVASIELMWNELNRLNIQDDVSFAMLNVFGRTFHRNSRGGRDHNRHHGVMVSFGRHVKGGVFGGVTGDGRCRNIRPNNGRPVNNGGIAADATLATAGRSMCAALGMSNREIDQRIQGGRILAPFLNS
ncbi:MAG: DUF1501 domain-containing protein [Bradymonadia bacterium]